MDRLKQAARAIALLSSVMLALPVTCARSNDPLYSGGIQASPASRINPFEPISNNQ